MRILFLFVADWNREVADYYRGIVPSHRIFGYAELKKMGHEPSVLPRPSWFTGWRARPIYWRLYQTFATLFRQRNFDCLFAINEAAALPALVFKRLGLLRLPIIVFNTGLMHPRNASGWRNALWKWLLPCAEAVVSQTRMELETTPRAFGLRTDRQFLMHMLVDMEFFKPDPGVKTGDYCLAVGTNEAKDYPTLLQAFPAEEKLIIVTDAYNAAIVEKNLRPGMPVTVLQAVPISKLKAMYQEAKVVINPLLETPYGSGHTVVLENMVLGKPVIVSGVGGMLDYYEDSVSAIGVKPNDVAELRQKLRDYLDHPEKFAHIGRQAPDWVRSFSSEEFAKKLIAIAEKLCPEAATEATSPVPATR